MTMRIEHLINGKKVAGRDYFETVNPATQEVLAEVACGGEKEVHDAVAAAKAAYPGWSSLAAPDRAKLIRKLGDLIARHVPEISQTETNDSGQVIAQTGKQLVPRAADNFYYFAEMCTRVHGYGKEAGEPLVRHSEVRAISFTGSTATGNRIVKEAGLKKFSMELGGKSPFVVFDDANFERALDAAIFMIFSNNGERCTAGSRILVQKSIYAGFVDQFVARARRIPVGDPLDEKTIIGPMISRAHLAKVRGYIEQGSQEGATLLCGGRMCFVNSQNVRDLRQPFGGTKASGTGREGGTWSYEVFLEPKNIAVSLGSHHIPHWGV